MRHCQRRFARKRLDCYPLLRPHLPLRSPPVWSGGFIGTDLQRAEAAIAKLQLADNLGRHKVGEVTAYWVNACCRSCKALL